MTFDPTAFGPAVAAILGDGQRLAPLGPGSPDPAMRAKIDALPADLPPACRAGLYLYHDCLDESHAISQELHTPDGSAWHAIMHRREPDAWNSNYWWRRVGPHSVLDQLRERSPDVGYRFTTAADFVDFCESARGFCSADEALAQRVQLLEWQLLFAWCFHAAASR